ncbi:MAG TPA: hypothetical protein VGB14_08440 [Acidimicrobiales bacterium]
MTRRCRGDRGVVGGVEVLPFGVLVFVAGSLLVANAWAVVDAKLAVTSAAREAVRAYVEAPDAGTAAATADDAARSALAGHGRDPARLGLTLDGGFGRCVPVVAVATYDVPAVSLPFVGGFGPALTVRAEHRELVDPFRAGLGGEADCG